MTSASLCLKEMDRERLESITLDGDEDNSEIARN